MPRIDKVGKKWTNNDKHGFINVYSDRSPSIRMNPEMPTHVEGSIGKRVSYRKLVSLSLGV